MFQDGTQVPDWNYNEKGENACEACTHSQNYAGTSRACWTLGYGGTMHTCLCKNICACKHVGRSAQDLSVCVSFCLCLLSFSLSISPVIIMYLGLHYTCVMMITKQPSTPVGPVVT